MLPGTEQSALYNATNVNLPSWVTENATVVTVQVNVYTCPTANNPTPTVSMVDGNGKLLPVANALFARCDYVYNVGWNDSGMPASVDYDNTITGCNGPLYRNSHITYAGVTDGLSNTVVAGERTPYLSDATWVGIIPGYRHFAYNAFASAGTGGMGVIYDYASAILAAHSGPSLYEDPVRLSTLDDAADHEAVVPRCPHCGSCRTRFLSEYPRFGVP